MSDELDDLVARLRKLADDMDRHAAPDWDEHEDVSKAADAITSLRADLAAAQARVAKLEAYREALSAGLAAFDDSLPEYLTELSRTVTRLTVRAENAEAQNRELAMQSLADLGQAQEAYEAQNKAEAERDAALTVQGAAKVLLTDLTDALDPMTTSREGASKDWLRAADAADEAPTCMVRPTALQMIRSALRALAGDTP